MNPIYRFMPSSIAALITVTTPNGVEHSCIYLSKEKGVVVGNSEKPLHLMDWPGEVKTSIKRHFQVVFNLRHEGWTEPGESPRAQFLRNILPWSLEVQL